jgi:hypothetical protein
MVSLENEAAVIDADLALSTAITSDCAALNGLIEVLIAAA